MQKINFKIQLRNLNFPWYYTWYSNCILDLNLNFHLKAFQFFLLIYLLFPQSFSSISFSPCLSPFTLPSSSLFKHHIQEKKKTERKKWNLMRPCFHLGLSLFILPFTNEETDDICYSLYFSIIQSLFNVSQSSFQVYLLREKILTDFTKDLHILQVTGPLSCLTWL